MWEKREEGRRTEPDQSLGPKQCVALLAADWLAADSLMEGLSHQHFGIRYLLPLTNEEMGAREGIVLPR